MGTFPGLAAGGLAKLVWYGSLWFTMVIGSSAVVAVVVVDVVVFVVVDVVVFVVVLVEVLVVVVVAGVGT